MLHVFISVVLAADPQGAIAFVSGDTPERYAVHVFDVTTGTARKVGPGHADGPPRWSPDGKWLAFESGLEPVRSIYVVRSDGTGGRFRPTGQPQNYEPRWSPQGSLLAYSAGPERRIAVHDLAADKEYIWGDGRAGLMRPVWLRDVGLAAELAFGDRSQGALTTRFPGASPSENAALLAIGFTTDAPEPSLDIFVVTPEEAYAFPGWALPGRGGYTEWAVEASPNGRDIAFESNDGGDREIFVLTRRGPHDASNHREADWNPVWSPDGKWIAFESFRSGRRGIYRVHRDTNRVFEVAASEAFDNWNPAWSPDSSAIVYVSNQTTPPALFVSDVKTPNARRLTQNSLAEYAPSWSGAHR